jgi:hypothetical protein
MKIAKLQETSNFKIIELNGVPTHLGANCIAKSCKKYSVMILHCTRFFTNIPLITILHDIIYMESSYLEILNSNRQYLSKVWQCL